MYSYHDSKLLCVFLNTKILIFYGQGCDILLGLWLTRDANFTGSILIGSLLVFSALHRVQTLLVSAVYCVPM